MKDFGKSMMSLVKKNYEEIKKCIDNIDFEEFENEINSYARTFADSFNDLKSKVFRQNGKYTIEVPYDRDSQIMTFTVEEGNVRTFKVNIKSCEDCDDNPTKSTFISETTLPPNVNTECIMQDYNKEEKKMVFQFTCDETISTDEEDVNDETEMMENDEPINEEERDETMSMDEEDMDDETEMTETINEADVTRDVENDNYAREDNHQALVNRMIDMHNNGLSFRQIAREVGLSDKTVARWIRRNQ